MTTHDGLNGTTRRAVLTTGATTVTLGLAGCTGSTGGGSDENGAGGGSDAGSTDTDGTDTDGSDDGGASAVNGSFFMLYDLARNVAGDQLDVTDLVPTGAHGDDWEPSPGIIEEVADADVFVYIDGFRSWSDNVAGALPDDYPDVVVVDAAERIDYIEGERGRDVDPHFWMDPLLAKVAVETIRDGFVEADPEHAETYEANADAFLDRLDDVHVRYEDVMDRRQQDLIVVGSHDSFQYWTERYDLDIYSPVGISPDGEPTAQEMQEITDLVDEHDLQYILYDMYEPTDYADSLAVETGTETLPLSPIEAATEEQLEQGMGYVEHMLEINLTTLERALEVPEEE